MTQAVARLAIAAAALAGCGGGATTPGDAATPAVVTLGGTDYDGQGFAALAGDQTLVPGAQGGFHVWLKYRVAGMAPERVHVHREVHRLADDVRILFADGSEEIGPAGTAGYWELPAALPSFICPPPLGIEVIDQPMRFDVTLSDDAGAPLGHGTSEATPHCPLGDGAAFCARICAG